MKRVFILTFLFGAFTLTSCKKEYQCNHQNGETINYSEKHYSNSQIDAAKNTCGKAGGKWSNK